MSYNFDFKKNIRIFLFLIYILILQSQEKQHYNIKKLNIYSSLKDSWNINEKYIYYTDINTYKLGEENVFQVLGEELYLMNNITVSEIDESIIFDSESEIIKKETYEKSFHIKLRHKPKRYYYEVLIKKVEKDQNYFVILIEPRIFQNNTEVDITISSIVQVNDISKNQISDGKIFSNEFYMDTKIERFIKFNLNDISLENSNLILFVADKGVSNFYINNITSQVKRTRLYIIPKNTTQKADNIIYLSLLGPANKTKFSIMLDDHDISYLYVNNRLISTFYIEKLNCTKDLYIFEDYSGSEDSRLEKNYHLDINLFYGDYEMIYYENLGSNISNLFHPDNNTMEFINETYIKKISSESNVLKLSCKKPTLLRLQYLEENGNLSLIEGQEKIVHLDRCESYYQIFKGHKIITKDINKEYKFYFGFYKLKETEELIKTSINTDIRRTFSNYDITDKIPSRFFDIYYDKDKPIKQFSVDVQNDNTYYRLYLISNQFYKNVVEGITKINSNEKSIAFKIRKDIVFDYFVFKAYSFNMSNLISINYDLKIVEKDQRENDKVLLGINPIQNFLKSEIYLRYSNPYDKFNSKIKEDDFVYLLIAFLSPDSFFPVYVDIRYYYNNSVITLEPSEAKVLKNNKAYKIFGGIKYNETEKLLLNINKCNVSKNYSIKTFYENENNLISIENIYKERTYLFHDNLFNNTKILFKNNNDSSSEENDSGELSYYKNGDLYMNYFPINEEFYNQLEITKDFSITFEDSYNSTLFKWNRYILNNNNEFPVNYSVYILPKTSQINSICQMSLIPPNISLINQNDYELYLDKGEYKISIIASIVNKNFPLTTYYNFMEFNIPNKYNIKLIIILSVSGIVILALTIFLIIYCKKKKKMDFDDIDLTRKSRLVSFTKALGIENGNEQEGVIFNNNDYEDENENENENIMNDNDKSGNKENE